MSVTTNRKAKGSDTKKIFPSVSSLFQCLNYYQGSSRRQVPLLNGDKTLKAIQSLSAITNISSHTSHASLCAGGN